MTALYIMLLCFGLALFGVGLKVEDCLRQLKQINEKLGR